MHQHNGNHAAEKHEQHNSQADKYSISNRVTLLFLAPERRLIGKTGKCCNWFRRLDPGDQALQHLTQIQPEI